jgi:hypothetical protein
MFIIQWGFIVTIPIRHRLYISYIVPIVSPPQHFPCPPFKAIARGFLDLFHIGVYEVHQPYTVPLVSFIHTSPFPLVPPYTLYLFYRPVFHC